MTEPAPGRPKLASTPPGGSEPRAAGSVGATEPAPGRPKLASTPSGGSEPRAAGSVGATEPAPGRPKLASAPSGGSEPRVAGSVGATSLRRQLMLGLLIPIAVLVAFNTWSLYRQALRNAHVAYDRTLLASAKTIGEQLDVTGYDAAAHIHAAVPHAALEAFEADSHSRMFYRVSGPDGALVLGHTELPAWQGPIPTNPNYAALVHFYDASYAGQPVRVAVLQAPVAGHKGRGIATIQVAETLELRERLARQILGDTVWREALLLLLLLGCVVLVVQRATRPVRELGRQVRERGPLDLAPLSAAAMPRELHPLIDATNQVMARLQHMLAHQQRFVRDAAHQLRTPLAVLKIQIQSARRGDVSPGEAWNELEDTVDRATRLANQMLWLARVEQQHQQEAAHAVDWSDAAREVALDVAPLLAQQQIDFELRATPVPVLAHDWMLRELTRNLLHNAIKIMPDGGTLALSLQVEGTQALLLLADSGPGISAALRERMFEPFARGTQGEGHGLGLAICREIVSVLGGTLRLDNRYGALGELQGLDARVWLPLAPETPAKDTLRWNGAAS